MRSKTRLLNISKKHVRKEEIIDSKICDSKLIRYLCTKNQLLENIQIYFRSASLKSNLKIRVIHDVFGESQDKLSSLDP